MELCHPNENEYIFVPDVKGSNVVYIKTGEKEVLLVPQGFPQSEKIIRANAKNIEIILLDNSELGKVDGCLTCCSVLIS